MALSNTQQAWVMLASALLIACGAVTIPLGLPPAVALVLEFVGAAGMFLKEFVGNSSAVQLPSSSNSAPNDPESATQGNTTLTVSYNAPFQSVDNAAIGVSGAGFPANSTGYLSANGIQIAIFQASATGAWTKNLVYFNSQANGISSLANAIADNNGKVMTIEAYDYATDEYLDSIAVTLA